MMTLGTVYVDISGSIISQLLLVSCVVFIQAALVSIMLIKHAKHWRVKWLKNINLLCVEVY
jgi:hypothetical protein